MVCPPRCYALDSKGRRVLSQVFPLNPPQGVRAIVSDIVLLSKLLALSLLGFHPCFALGLSVAYTLMIHDLYQSIHALRLSFALFSVFIA